jgi:hypothetical protein
VKTFSKISAWIGRVKNAGAVTELVSRGRTFNFQRAQTCLACWNFSTAGI